MLKITRLGWTAYAIAIVTIVLDQISKAWILATLGTRPAPASRWPDRST
jgi:signal peptidase II